MLGETRAGTKALLMAEQESRLDGEPGDGTSQGDHEGSESRTSGSSDKRKTLKEEAAEIARKFAAEAELKSKNSVAKGANKTGNDSHENSQAARDSDKNGGAQGDSGTRRTHSTSSKSTKSSGSRGSSSTSSNSRKDSENIDGAVEALSSIPKDQGKTHSSRSHLTKGKSSQPPAKKAKTSHDQNVSFSSEFFWVINNLNCLISESALGMKKGFEGLALAMNQNFSKLSRDLESKLGGQSDEEEEDEEEECGSSSPFLNGDQPEHQISEEEGSELEEDSEDNLKSQDDQTHQEHFKIPKIQKEGDKTNSSQSPSLPIQGTETSVQMNSSTPKSSLFAKKRA